MIGILLATHGSFGEGIMESAEMVMGHSEKLKTIKLLQDDDVTEFRERLVSCLDELDDGDGVLVMLDILGGSPYNVAAASIPGHHVECLTGLNLPMLLEAVDSRERCSLKELAEESAQAAKNGVIDVKDYLGLGGK